MLLIWLFWCSWLTLGILEVNFGIFFKSPCGHFKNTLGALKGYSWVSSKYPLGCFGVSLIIFWGLLCWYSRVISGVLLGCLWGTLGSLCSYSVGHFEVSSSVFRVLFCWYFWVNVWALLGQFRSILKVMLWVPSIWVNLCPTTIPRETPVDSLLNFFFVPSTGFSWLLVSRNILSPDCQFGLLVFLVVCDPEISCF